MSKIIKQEPPPKTELEPAEDPTFMLPPEMLDGMGMVSPVADTPLDAVLAEGFTIEKVVTLKPGEQIMGLLLGEGAAMKLEKIGQPGVFQDVKTWRIQRVDVKTGKLSKAVARMLGSAQLDSTLPAYPAGTFVLIQHLGQIAGKKGNRINQYNIFHKLPPERGLPAPTTEPTK